LTGVTTITGVSADPALPSPPVQIAWLLLVGAVLFAGLWVARHVVDFIFRPRVRAGQATPPEFDLPPALVCLLANGCSTAPQASAATLLDLAALGRLDIEQPGPDPTSTTVGIGAGGGGDLLPYEQKVFDKVNDLVALNAPNRTTLGELARLHRDELDNWNRSVEELAIADALRRGLVVERDNRMVWLFVVGVYLSCTLAFGLPYAVEQMFIPADKLTSWYAMVGLFGGGACVLMPMVFVMMAVLGHRVQRYRPTRAGRRVMAYWLGVRRYLRGQGGFAELPPAGVEVWGRYLAYGSALGATPFATAATGLTGDRPTEIGTVYGGQFRVLRVRYPGRLKALSLRSRVTLCVLAGGVLALVVPAYGLRWGHGAGVILAGLVGAFLAYVLIRCLVDVLFPATVEGLVVSRTEVRGRAIGRQAASYAVVIDSGTGYTARAWLATSAIGQSCVPNHVVAARARRWSGRITDISSPGSHPPGTMTTKYDLQAVGPTRPKGTS
jgi:hypothetical protein